jgi:hypothetical protein
MQGVRTPTPLPAESALFVEECYFQRKLYVMSWRYY